MAIAAKHRNKLVAAALLLICTAAIADTVTINGYNYSCENQCVLRLWDGVWTLSDSGGGLVRNTGPAKKPLPPRG